MLERNVNAIKIKSDKKPPKRSSFGLCKLNNNTIAIFGGYDGHLKCYYDDFWMLTGFKNNKYKWIQIKKQDNTKWPTERAGNTLDYHAKLKNIYLYGGRNDQLYGLSHELDDLWCFNIKSKKWKRIETGWMKEERQDKSHKCKSVIYKDYIIFFFSGFPQNAIYALNCLNETWNVYRFNNIPSERTNYGMCIIENIIVIYGGINNDLTLDVPKQCSYADERLRCLYSINIDNLLNKMDDKWIEINLTMPWISDHTLLCDNKRMYSIGHMETYSGYKGPMVSVAYLFKHEFYQRYFSVHSKSFIPSVVTNEIEKFIGKHYDIYFGKYIRYNSDVINLTQNHNGCVIYIKKEPYIFIFGGISHIYLNDSFLIKL